MPKLQKGQRPIDLVLVGGGHANIQVVRLLKNVPGVNVTLINDHTSSYYPGMLPGMLAGMYSEKDLQVSMKELTSYGGARFILGRAVSVDGVCNEVTIAPIDPWTPKPSPVPSDVPPSPLSSDTANSVCKSDSCEVPHATQPESPATVSGGEVRVHFDLLSINVGSQTKASRSVPGVEENACTTRPLYRLMKKVENFETGFFQSKGKEKPTQVRVCTVGAGMAGVELATALEKRFHDKFGVKVISTIVSHLPLQATMRCQKLGTRVHNSLTRRGYECIFGKKVARVDPNHVLFTDETTLDFDLMLWACGAEPPALLHDIGESGFVQVDPEKCGFVKVSPSLQSVSRPDVFGAGDCVSIPQYPGLAKAGVMAVREGPILGHNLLQCIKALQTALQMLRTLNSDIESDEWNQAKKEALKRCSSRFKRFKPKSDTLKLLNMSDGTAIGGYKRHSFEGKFALRLKDYLDRRWMRSFQDCGLGCD